MKHLAWLALLGTAAILGACTGDLGTGTGGGGNGNGGHGGTHSTSSSSSSSTSGITIDPGTGGGGNGGGGGGAGDCGVVLKTVVRDFSPSSHPDFESVLGDDKGIVQADLGADQKPVYAGNPETPTTHGKAAFDEWYRDTGGINVAIPLDITLTAGAGGVYTYDNQLFFPIDGQGFGDEGNPHNYHFTLEAHTRFQYKGGEVFTFTGDDDLFTFVNGKLAIDLGGVHGAESQTIDLDAMAGQLGIVKGQIYALDLFFAERHTTESHFRIDTTIGCFTPIETPH